MFPAPPTAVFACTKYSNLNSHFNLHAFYINFSFAKVTGETHKLCKYLQSNLNGASSYVRHIRQTEMLQNMLYNIQ